jgi:hypothetical protein
MSRRDLTFRPGKLYLRWKFYGRQSDWNQQFGDVKRLQQLSSIKT